FAICHTDAAWNSQSETAGLCWTFLESRSFQPEHSETALHVASPLMAEALAIRSAMFHAKSLFFNKVSVNSDSQQIIKAIPTRSPPSEIYGVISDILLCSSEFQVTIFKFIPRAANVKADSFSKQALWTNCGPEISI
ncbi:hypothetical protein EUTSA_v10019636mg, partial [Eutrema salsugineum]